MDCFVRRPLVRRILHCLSVDIFRDFCHFEARSGAEDCVYPYSAIRSSMNTRNNELSSSVYVSWLAMRRRISLLSCLLLVAITLADGANAPHSDHSDGYQIVHSYPHDPDAFTQGLVFADGHLYESTGRNGKSSVRMVDLSTGRVLQHYDLPAKYFGEGLTSWGSDLIQLTWKSELGFVYNRFSFALKHTFHYQGEGWGLTHDEKQLILSDGTPVLRFVDPQSFSETKRISVTDEKGHPLSNINELEYIRDEIYANVWQTDQIVRISPRTGKVLGWIDLNGLMDKSQLANPDFVLNGIAYDAKTDRLFVTGKLWPKLFEIKVIHNGRRHSGTITETR
jgi:glutaminyl-peptide cyclotransferase